MAANETLQQMMPSPASFSEKEILSFLINNGTIDLRDVEEKMKQERREKIFQSHPYKIYQGSDGRWRTHLPDKDKPEKRKLIVKTSRDDLEELLCQYYESLVPDRFRKNCTLKDIYPAWIEYKTLHVCETTVLRVEKDWNKYYASSDIINKPIVRITKLEIDVWVHEMIREHSMNSHKYGNFSLILRQLLNFAVANEIIDRNPFLDVTINRSRVLVPEVKKPDSTQVFTRKEEDMLIERAWESFYRKENYVQRYTPLAIIFLFYTGLRVGEVSALRFEDITGNNMFVHRIVRMPYENIVEHTKGRDGSRTIPLIPKAMEIINLIREHRIEQGIDASGYVFSVGDKPGSTYNAIERAIKKYCRDVGIPERSPHKERKTFTSTLLDNGVSVNTARQLCGHVDERTTLNNYCYDRSDDEEKLAKIEEALAG